MSTTRSIGRLSEIAQVMVRHGFGYFLEAHKLSDLLPGRSAEERLADMAAAQGAASARGQHLREVLDELGPTFVKFGQLLSTRPDVVPPDIVDRAARAPGRRPAVPVRAGRARDRGGAREHARAALPRVRARAGRGRVDRPGASRDAAERAPSRGEGAAAGRTADRSRRTSALLYQAARLARERIRALDFVDTRQLVDEFARSIRKELDYRQEGRNAQNFHRHFAGHPHVHVPKVYWQYTRPRVLTLEWIDGIQLADVDLVTTSLEERREIAYRITEAWMTMIFRHGFFHGDPHPANILLPVEAGTIGLVDFGAVGTLTDDDMSKLTRPLHRRREREHRRSSRGAWPTSACAIRRSGRGSSSPSCASCTTATTAPA